VVWLICRVVILSNLARAKFRLHGLSQRIFPLGRCPLCRGPPLKVKRHTQGSPSVFGVDNVDITLSGKSTPTIASCFGTANQAPGMTLQATLIRIVDQ
jgi:hypothetical protein